MKKLLITALCLSFLLISCTGNQIDTNSYMPGDTSEIVSEIPSVSSTLSDDNSESTSSNEEVFEFAIDAKTAVETISKEISLTADAVEIDKHFLFEKTAVSNDMYDDFHGMMSYEISDNSSVLVFCCNTAAKTTNLRKHIENILSSDPAPSFFEADTKIISYQGYIIVVTTKNNFDEENLVSKLIQ